MMTTVDDQNEDFSNALIVLATKTPSSMGSELPGCPSCNAGAFRKVTADRLPAAKAAVKSFVSYWWFA